MAPSPTAEATRFIESSHVAGGEDPRDARLEREGAPGQRPARLVVPGQEIGAGDDEAPLVSRNVVPSQFVRGGAPMGTDSCGHLLLGAGQAIDERDLLEVVAAPPRDDLGAEPHLDVLRRDDPLDQVPRHRLLEGVATHEDHHVPGEAAMFSAACPAELAAPTM